MQDPNADTEWNDILRSKGILPPKEEATVDEETVVQVTDFHVLHSLLQAFEQLMGCLCLTISASKSLFCDCRVWYYPLEEYEKLL